jgi:hypothetical protein
LAAQILTSGTAVSFSGCTSSSGNTCLVVMNGNRTVQVTVTFGS